MTHLTGRRCAPSVVVRCGLFLLLGSPLSVPAADRISIIRGDCAQGVHLVARGARLSDVLMRLSEELGFQLHLIGSSDSVVDIDIFKQAPELIAKLSPIDNLIIAQARDPLCAGRSRVVKVWLLSKGNQGSPKPAAGATPPTRAISEAEVRQARENDNMYRKAHGMPPLAD